MTPPSTRLVAGIMSGTSLDGIAVCIVQLSGHQTDLSFKLVHHSTTPYSPALKEQLFQAATSRLVDIDGLCQLNVRLAHAYAEAVRSAANAAGLSLSDLDLVGSHGQTVRHLPKAQDCADVAIRSTLQIGDPSVLAQLLGVPVVGDFRLADMAFGGQGAPLVPYLDYIIFSHPTETRACLNLGGIANLTILPAGQKRDEVYGFDTGPANMVIDALAQDLFEKPYDDRGQLAAQGQVCERLLATLLQDEFLQQAPPKSTGREYFGPTYVKHLRRLAKHHSRHDLIATATAFTAASIYQAYVAFVAKHHPLDRLIVAGGGVHNATLMRSLQSNFDPVVVETTRLYRIDEDAKEALCFAVLAHETASGYPTGMPSVTGASQSAVLGKYCPVIAQT